MKTQAGLWIDHKDAFIVFMDAGAEATHRVESGVEKHVRYSGHSAKEGGAAENQQDRQFAEHLNKYYDQVIEQIEEVESLLIFGPGEAKGEFKKRLEAKGLGERIVGVETADKMTDHQVAAKVRQHFLP